MLMMQKEEDGREEGGNARLAVSFAPPRDSATLPQFGPTFLMILMMMVMMMFLVVVVVVVVLMVILQPTSIVRLIYCDGFGETGQR